MHAERTILLAEDEEDDVFLMQRALAKLQVPVRMEVVHDGEEVLHYLSGEGPYADRQAFPLPSLLLLDLKMPRKTGLEVLEWLEGRPEFAGLPAVMLTSSLVARDIKRAKNLGAKAYLVKSVRSEELRRLVSEPVAFLAESHWPQAAIPAEAPA
jgi:CheY-like chemotaxis protein